MSLIQIYGSISSIYTEMKYQYPWHLHLDISTTKIISKNITPLFRDSNGKYVKMYG